MIASEIQLMSNLTRKQFLTVIVTSFAGAAIGCGDDETGASANNGGSGQGGDGNQGGAGTGGMGTGGGGMGTGGMGTGGGGACASGAEATAISNNHMQGNETPHTLMTIAAGDISGGGNMTYALEMGGGANMHSHDITLTAADFTTLLGGGSVTVTSTPHMGGGGNSHMHDVTISCA
jgi:hypothetical protein